MTENETDGNIQILYAVLWPSGFRYGHQSECYSEKSVTPAVVTGALSRQNPRTSNCCYDNLIIQRWMFKKENNLMN